MKQLLFVGLVLSAFKVFAQPGSVRYPLRVITDSTAYPFSYISPAKELFQVKIPKIDLQYYSLSRSIKLESLGSVLTVLIGKDKSNQNLVIFDSNFDNDLSDEQVHYFPDSVTSPTKGNFLHFGTDIPLPGQTLSLEFDYSIIKPKALNISFGDSLEDKIHFMVRPFQYRYATIRIDTSEYKLVLFSKNFFDFSKTSTSLSVLPGQSDVHKLKSADKSVNKYTLGDIVLMAENKFLFEKITGAGDSIVLSPLAHSAETYGSKTGFLSPDYLGRDILSNDSLLIHQMKGKYVLLDFWGTWCAPCIKILDDIKKLHASLDPQKVKMIGVCYDTDVKKVKHFMKNRAMGWTQIFDPQTSSTLGKMFEITAYPSFVLIDPNGKIIYRDEGIDGFNRTAAKLDELL